MAGFLDRLLFDPNRLSDYAQATPRPDSVWRAPPVQRNLGDRINRPFQDIGDQEVTQMGSEGMRDISGDLADFGGPSKKPVFRITTPSGAVYKVEGPDEQAALATLQKLIGPQSAPTPMPSEPIDEGKWQNPVMERIRQLTLSGAHAVSHLTLSGAHAVSHPLETIGNIATGVTEAAKLPGHVYSGEANLNDPETVDKAISLGLMISPAAPAGLIGAKAALPAAVERAAVPTAENIGALKSAAYKKADELGAAYSPEAYSELVDKIAADAEAANISPDVHHAASAAIKNLQKDAEKRLAPAPELTKPEKIPFELPKDAGPAPREASPTSLIGFLQRTGVQDEGGDLASMGFTRFPGLVRPLKGVPMDEALRRAVAAGYLEPHETVADFINKVAEHPTYSVLDQEVIAARAAKEAEVGRFSPGEFPPSSSDMFPGDTSKDQIQGRPITLTKLDQKRQMVARDVAGSNSPAERFFGKQIIKNIDEFIANSGPKQMAAGAAPEAAEAIQTARDLNTRFAKTQNVEKAVEKARRRAASTGSGGNVDNAIRQNLRSVFEKGTWTPEERVQFERAIRGTSGQNLLRAAGKFSPTSGGLIALLEITGAAAGGWPMAAVPAAGMAAKIAADRATKANVKKLTETILAGKGGPVSTRFGKFPRTRAGARALAAAMSGTAIQIRPQASENPNGVP